MRITRLFALLALAAAVACGTDYYSGPTSAIDIDKDTFAPSLGIDLATMTTTTDGVYYKDKVEGTGATVASGDSIAVWYVGYLSGGSIFDAGNFPGNLAGSDTTSLRFRVGTTGIIQGFSSGVTGMKVGGRRLFIVPSTIGFGAAGRGSVPRYANLVFDVQVNTKF